MSTVPQGSMHATVPEFNDETLYDPLLMSEAMSEEQLVHIHSQNHTPNPQPGFAPPTAEMAMGKSDNPPSAGGGGRRMTTDSSTWFGRIDSGLSNSSLNFPFDPDNTPLAYGDTTFDANLMASSEQQLASPVEPPSRKSSGLATVSGESHLMSPTLTNDTNEPVSPITHLADGESYKLLGGGHMSRGSSLSTINPSTYHYLHTTPAPTRSSAVSSPDPSAADMRPVSPLVRVVDVGHGEASAHIVHAPQPMGKRPREQSRSNLHPEDAHNSYDDMINLDGDDDEDEPGNAAGSGPGSRSGVAPSNRNKEEDIPSINEATASRKMSERNDQVASWLWTRDAPDSNSYLDPNQGIHGVRGRIRSKSQSKNSQQLRADAFRSLQGRRKAQDESTPGPDVLVDESSGDDDDGDSGSYQESAPASIDGKAEAEEQQSHASLSRLDSDEKSSDSYFWSDPFRIPSMPGQRTQPGTANAAIMRFQMRNLDPDIETASRAATWGTRRMSDSTIDQVFGSGGFFSRLKLTNSKEKEEEEHEREIRSSLQEGVDHLRQRYRAFRSNSVNKRKGNDRPGRPVRRTDTYMRGVSPHERPDTSESTSSTLPPAATGGAAASSTAHMRKPSNGAFNNIMQRIPSTRRSGHSRPTTPRIETGSSKEDSRPPSIDTSHHSPPPSSPSSGGGFKEGFRRFREGLHRHLSDDSHSSSDTLAAMLHKTGGPPVPAITSQRADHQPQEQQQQQQPAQRAEATLKPDNDEDGDDDDDDDDVATVRPETKTEHGVKMPMSPSKDLIIPNFEGFKSNAKDVNPRLDPWLVERLGQEQLRRYKRLVEMKVQHYKHVAAGTCPSGDFCVAKGGQPRYFAPPKSAHKDSVSSGEADMPLEDMDEDEQAIAEGTVTEAQFPLGLPMPPVQRLPAEFECPFCFTVKKFTKPSDWSKHVHEDLQPFTCTFKNCSDPKSFKRKADWVRHENERHRQLEWWECTEEGCQHRCYRRDNFVQHLIREHKLPEPVTKPAKQPNKPAVRGPAKSKGRGRGNTTNINDVPPEEKVLLMVEICRHETKKNAVEERCRFCGNVCNSWKKLTVHLARHMEQLSIPVLELVKLREVSVDTIISPLEPRPPMQASVSPVEQTSGNTFNSPHPFSTASSNNVQMALAGNVMDPGAFALQDPGFGSAQFDSTGWGTWPNPQAAAQLSYGGGFGAMPQPGYVGAGDSSGATYMSQGNGRGMYMQDAGTQQPYIGSGSLADQQAVAAAMASGNVYGQQPQQHDSQQAYGQTTQWPAMQYGPSPGQQAAYGGASRGATGQQQHPQPHSQHSQQQPQQQYYNAQWQQ